MSHNHGYDVKTRADEILYSLRVLTSLALEHFEEHEEARVEDKAIEQPGEMEAELKQMGRRLEEINLRLDDWVMDTKMDH